MQAIREAAQQLTENINVATVSIAVLEDLADAICDLWVTHIADLQLEVIALHAEIQGLATDLQELKILSKMSEPRRATE